MAGVLMALQCDEWGEIEQRIPPQNVDLEMAVLGGILLEPQAAYPLAADILTRDSFYLDGHGILFDIMGQLHRRGIPPDAQSVLDELRAQGLLQRVGGSGVVMGMLNAVPTAANVESHARKVQDKADLRALIRGCSKVIEEGYRQQLNRDEVFGLAEDTLTALIKLGQKAELLPAASHLADYMEMVTAREEMRSAMAAEGHDIHSWVPGVQSGFPTLDRKTKGFQHDRLTTILARTSTGKSALMLTMAHEMAVERNVPVGFISLEMPVESLMNRMLAIGTKHTCAGGAAGFIDSMRIEQVGEPLDAMEWSLVTRSSRRLSDAPFYPKAPGNHWRGAGGIFEAIKEMVRKGCEVIFVDYLQEMEGGGDSDWEAVGRNAQMLKQTARRYGIHIITASQVNDTIFGTSNKKSGWIGKQNASRSRIIVNVSDIVIAIEPLAFDKDLLEKGEFRVGKRWAPTESGDWPDGPRAHDDRLGHFQFPGALHVIKCRDGQLGWVPVGWYPKGQRFVERSMLDESSVIDFDSKRPAALVGKTGQVAHCLHLGPA